MREFGLKHAALINSRHYSWDNSYMNYSRHMYPNLFVAYGPSDPLGPIRPAPLLGVKAGVPGYAVQPYVCPTHRLAKLPGALAVVMSGRADGCGS